jgi:putative membrane protein
MRAPLIVPALALFAMAGMPPVFAQSSATQNTSPNPPAVSTSNGESKTTAAPVAGKNSFTEAEAKKRLESFGYTDVSSLHQDAQSIWRGTATKNGKSTPVALDYQGNVVTR